MVNKKLSPEDEDLIYMDHLKGVPLTHIAKKFPVVISTIQRVVKKKDQQDGSMASVLIHNVFKHLKYANEPLEKVIQMINSDIKLHKKQQQFLLESIDNINKNIDILIESIRNLKIDEIK